MAGMKILYELCVAMEEVAKSMKTTGVHVEQLPHPFRPDILVQV